MYYIYFYICVYKYIYLFMLYIYICTYIFYITHSACWKTFLVRSKFISEENWSQIFFQFICILFSIVINGISCSNQKTPFVDVLERSISNWDQGTFLHNPDWILRGSLVKKMRNRILNFRIFSQWCFCLPSPEAENFCPSKLCCCGLDGTTELGK